MTQLQEAAKAAKVRLSLPECPVCHDALWSDWLGGATSYDLGPVSTCRACGGCGVDVSNPDALTGRAMRWLSSRWAWATVVTAASDARVVVPLAPSELHDGTAEGVATACLRLVARCAT